VKLPPHNQPPHPADFPFGTQLGVAFHRLMIAKIVPPTSLPEEERFIKVGNSKVAASS